VKKFVEESWLVLVMGVIFACLLAGTQTSLSARIAENQQRVLLQAIGEVVPGVETTEEFKIESNQVFKCLDKNGELVGWAVDASGGGFVDKIRLVVGIRADGREITGLKVIENLETPGLGNKIEGPWAEQYTGISTDLSLTVIKGDADPARGEISAITGATWSSRYVTDIVNDVLTRIRPKLAEQQ